MGLFDKGKDEVIESLRNMATELRDENARLTRELETYRRDYGGVSKLKEVAERLTEDNKALLDKVENFSETERQLKHLAEEKNLEISRLQQIIQQKKEEIALKTFAIVAQDSDINLSADLVLTGGLKTTKNINLGDGVIIKGNVEAGEAANFGTRNVVYGEVNATVVTSKAECEFKGSIKGREAFLGDRNVMNAPVIIEKKLEIGNLSEAKEEIYCKGDILVGSDSILQKAMADGSLKIGTRTTVQRIVSEGAVELERVPE